ncbi:GntR family transcriptional regulator [Micromonospora humi]|uniref:DNA-binding transcriptional regulator YhcF, GntR family n=1 Tax=Micromonospora humi TaxID=745366 RepID=A0A1C5HIS6_9ACTN|nr:GntR family transcriptional regulator [Micromonospora humi]SCG45823.1 DNA-binding transcriptional regulator YhcF, GntR family [Micromonospora humi]
MTGRPTLTVSTDDPTPPYEQLRRQLSDLIEYGVLGPGERLPPLRQLASDLGLAVGTVARAYRELEVAGLIISRRGGGTRVAVNPRRASEEVLHERAAIFVRDARLLGADDEEIKSAVTRALGR